MNGYGKKSDHSQTSTPRRTIVHHEQLQARVIGSYGNKNDHSWPAKGQRSLMNIYLQKQERSLANSYSKKSDHSRTATARRAITREQLQQEERSLIMNNYRKEIDHSWTATGRTTITHEGVCDIPNYFGLENMYHYETDELSNPRPTQSKTQNRLKVASGPLFPTANQFLWVGIAFV